MCSLLIKYRGEEHHWEKSSLDIKYSGEASSRDVLPVSKLQRKGSGGGVLPVNRVNRALVA